MAGKAADDRPIIIKRVKKIAGGHHGGAWKVAYADFVTAMMAFFMLLWLLSSPDKAKLKGLAEYFTPSPPSSASGTGPQGGAPGSGAGSRSKGKTSTEQAAAGPARGGTATVPDASQRVVAAELQIAIDSIAQPSDGKKNVTLAVARDGLRITLMDNDRQSMFRPGTAELNPYARIMLGKIAEKLSHTSAQLAIEGHTDGTGGQSDANWQLSGARALAARSALIAAGMTPDRFAEIVALGASQPVYPEQPDRPENRRITVVVMGQQSALPSDASFKF
ncbi:MULTISPECIES: flagellar motor protein MotB [Sphingomonas]|jgi:chemotaxis protein MotB|uniref:Flagellar motor protein MotB n=1 Tax=Sphingomonas echinoides TaxID=59803 RepID=A0ABU4PHH7_9SPHN|nr:flagellar motor protein MotB [Sphingomonas echinoides]MDX5983651.1 flagellar motor protein MotB [Sphingomonas echinoides]